MGAVYEGIHDEIERKVAIKILRQEHASNAELVTRFFNEARAVNRISHPSIVQVFDCGRLSDNTAYLIMEFLDGETLHQRSTRVGGALKVGDALRIVSQMADALTATHAKGIVHRDLKPENVMLVHDPAVPGRERVKLLDFGIAKLTSAVESTERMRTGTNEIFGTPYYMSPEQCEGAAGVDERADVYSLGVMLYEMLAGKLPFNAPGYGAVITQHMLKEPPPLLEAAPHAPADIATLVHKMLIKDRQQRPKMREVLAEIERLSSTLSTRSGNHGITSLPIENPDSLGFSSRRPNDSESGSKPQTSLPRRRLQAVILGMGLLVVGIISAAALHGKPPEPSATPDMSQVPKPAPVIEPVAAKIRWQITSEPPGAAVIDKAKNEPLGRTPWSVEQVAAPGDVQVRIVLNGFKEQSLVFSKTRSQEEKVILLRNRPVKKAGGPNKGADAGPKREIVD